MVNRNCKFAYKQKVKIMNGFYKGIVGKVVRVYPEVALEGNELYNNVYLLQKPGILNFLFADDIEVLEKDLEAV